MVRAACGVAVRWELCARAYSPAFRAWNCRSVRSRRSHRANSSLSRMGPWPHAVAGHHASPNCGNAWASRAPARPATLAGAPACAPTSLPCVGRGSQPNLGCTVASAVPVAGACVASRTDVEATSDASDGSAWRCTSATCDGRVRDRGPPELPTCARCGSAVEDAVAVRAALKRATEVAARAEALLDYLDQGRREPDPEQVRRMCSQLRAVADVRQKHLHAASLVVGASWDALARALALARTCKGRGGGSGGRRAATHAIVGLTGSPSAPTPHPWHARSAVRELGRGCERRGGEHGGGCATLWPWQRRMGARGREGGRAMDVKVSGVGIEPRERLVGPQLGRLPP